MTDVSPDIKTSPGNTKSKTKGCCLDRAVGCLTGIAGIVLFVLWIIASFTPLPPDKVYYAPYVIDSLSLLQKNTTDQLRKIKFPEDLTVLVETIDTIPESEFGKFATKQMEEAAYWDSIVPVSYLRKRIWQQKPWDKGIYIIVSEEPRLIQIRYGPRIRMEAYKRGVAYGPWYTNKQHYIPSELDSLIVLLVGDLSNKFIDINDRSWISKVGRSLASLVWADIEDMIMASDNFYSNFFLKNYIKFMHWIRATKSLNRLLLASVAFYIVFWLINIMLVIPLTAMVSKTFHSKIVFKTVLSFTEIASLILSLATILIFVRGRAEDILALKAMGIHNVEAFDLKLSFFVKKGGLLFGIPITLLTFFMESLEGLDHETDRVNYNYFFLGWGVLFFILPRAFGLFLLFYIISSFLKNMIIKWYETGHMDVFTDT